MEDGVRNSLLGMQKIITDMLEEKIVPDNTGTVFLFCVNRHSGDQGNAYATGWGNLEEISEQMLKWMFDQGIELKFEQQPTIEGGEDATQKSNVIQGPWSKTKQ